MLVKNYTQNFFPSINKDNSHDGNEGKNKLLKLLEWKKKILNFINEIYFITFEDNSEFDFSFIKIILDLEKINIIEQIPILTDEKYIDFYLNSFIPFCNKIIEISNSQNDEIFIDYHIAKKLDLNTLHFFFEFFIQKLFKSLEKKMHDFQINGVKQFLKNFCQVEYIDDLFKDILCEQKPITDDSKIHELKNTKKEKWEAFKNLVLESDIIKNVSQINIRIKKLKFYKIFCINLKLN